MPRTVAVDAALLRRWPLPAAPGHADKEDRGRVLVIAGSRELVGAAVLAAEAALRAGAGKLVVATGASVAAGLGPALPEARIVGLAETKAGGFAVRALADLEPLLNAADAVLIGPGLADARATRALVAAVAGGRFAAPLVLDALAMEAVADLGRLERPVLITPHAGEMASLTGEEKTAIEADPERAARDFAAAANLVVALKGAATHVATPDGRCWRHARAVPGLATSGSGDTLAGLVAGLLARGADLAQAAVWAVALHARAGEALERRLGPVGTLARELAAEVPALLARLGARPGR
jgi:ADP-dependent NAD(P)H-hydrate dehydratase